jgi:hypothetical protein
MAENQLRGKSVTAVARDVAEGYFSLNPLVLKKFDPEAYKALHQALRKLQTEIRGTKYPLHDIQGIRQRNSHLQRLHSALMVLEHSAREKRIVLI